MSEETEIAIIGAGIVGLAIGLEITRRFPQLSVCVIDKDPAVASHQTSHNSGVVHSGIYYRPGSLKAKLCVEGASSLLRFCEEHGVASATCGKIIVATREDELPRLNELYMRGQNNGLRGLRMIGPEEIRELEPHAAGLRGVHVPGTAIVDYKKVAEKFALQIREHGGTIRLSQEVIALKRYRNQTIVETTRGPIAAKLVVNCAGLQSDRISRLAGAKLDLAIIPFRGEYYEIPPERDFLIKGLIYPVPDPQFPFLGVHFTRRIGGGIEAGPNAVLALKREGYSKRCLNVRDVLEFAAFPGFWIMASQHWRMSLGEYHRSWSKRAFVRALQRLVPELRAQDLFPGGSGVRAQALSVRGQLIDDFRIEWTEGMIHVCNVPSPAATASLAIARHIVETAVKRLGGDLGVTG
jgi:L-2-hydroxyglutarate oxidase LhgO